ncbi:replication/maintenance protein RepL, partial [Bacillus paramycoides]
IGGKKLKVVNYILDNVTLANNSLIITTEELAERSGVSRFTVNETLKALTNANIIKRKTGAIMLNPSLLVRGDENKQKFLLIEFDKFESQK